MSGLIVAIPYGCVRLICSSAGICTRAAVLYIARELELSADGGSRTPYAGGEGAPAKPAPGAELAQTDDNPRSQDGMEHTLRSVPCLNQNGTFLEETKPLTARAN